VKEGSFTIREELARGLRLDPRIGRNVLGFERLVNMRPTQFGLSGVGVIPRAYATLPGGDFPFPQIFRGSRETLVVSETALRRESAPGTLATVTTYDADEPSVTAAITAGGPWQFVDLDTVWMLTNGACCILKPNLAEYGGKALVFTGGPQGACFHKGRVWMAGWPGGFLHPQWGTIGADTITWSAIGGGDVFAPFLPFGSAYAQGAEILINDAGNAPLPMEGTVYGCLPLGGSVLVYGERGIAALTPAPNSTAVGKQILLAPDSIGIKGRLAAGGDLRNHWFIAQDGALWTIGQSLEPKRLGYSEYFAAESGPFVISHDPLADELYIATPSRGFILSAAGLAETDLRPTGLVAVGKELKGASFGLPSAVGLMTHIFDAGDRSRKTSEFIEIAARGLADVEVRVHADCDASGTFEASDWEPVNELGAARVIASGVDFKVELKAISEGPLATIDYITVRWKGGDKRFRRGVGINAGETGA